MTNEERMKLASKAMAEYIKANPRIIMDEVEKMFLGSAIFISKSQRQRFKEFNHDLLEDLRKLDKKGDN